MINVLKFHVIKKILRLTIRTNRVLLCACVMKGQ